jgi:hypothetical protein
VHTLLNKLMRSMKTDALPKALARVYKAGTAKIISIPRRLENQYALLFSLPRRARMNRRSWTRLSDGQFQNVRRQTLNYLSTNAKPGFGPGAYSYKLSGPALLYASCYAVLTRHLYNDLDHLSPQLKAQWCTYIQPHRSDDGLFRDSLIDIALAEQLDWQGWRHSTLHALMTLSTLGVVVQKTFRILFPLRQKGQMTQWLTARNWQGDPASVSNEMQNPINPLSRLYFLTDYRRNEIRKFLEKALPWVMTKNSDGGWIFRRYESFQHRHPLTYARREESSMFPAWFRSLSLTYLWNALSKGSNAESPW